MNDEKILRELIDAGVLVLVRNYITTSIQFNAVFNTAMIDVIDRVHCEDMDDVLVNASLLSIVRWFGDIDESKAEQYAVAIYRIYDYIFREYEDMVKNKKRARDVTKKLQNVTK